AVAAGTRRIEALTGRAAEAYLIEQHERVQRLAERLWTTPSDLEERIETLQSEVERLREQAEEMERLQAASVADVLVEGATMLGETRMVVARVEAGSIESLRDI